MKRTDILITFVLLCIFSNSLFGQGDNDPIVIGHKHFIKSTMLNENREFWVYLPSDYNASLYNYPVLFLLDGQEHFHQATGLVNHMSRLVQKMPSMIVVGVISTDKDRVRDYTPNPIKNFPNSGGVHLFTRFLKEELIPRINKEYRTNNYRLLFGHSLAGLYVDYLFVKDNELFRTYFAADPAIFLDSTITDNFKKLLTIRDTIKGNYFLSVSGDVKATTITPNFELYNFIKLSYPNKLKWDFIFYPNDDHISMTLKSLYEGLEKMFDGYKMPTNYLNTYDKSMILNHISLLEKTYGIEVAIPEQAINEYAMLFYTNGKYEDALELLQFNIKNYKMPFETYYFIGEAYRLKGDKNNALLYFQKSLDISEFCDVKDKIKQLNSK